MSIFSQFKFDLCYAVKKLSPGTEPLIEMVGGKRLWMKADDMTLDIYRKHCTPTIYNTDMAILSTRDYIPEYLKGIVAKKLGKYLCKSQFFIVQPKHTTIDTILYNFQF